MVFSDEVGEEFDLLAPFKKGAETEIEAERFPDVLDPEFGAGGGENEATPSGAMLLDLGNDLRISELGEPVADKGGRERLKPLALHAPEVAVEDALHATGSEEFIEGEKKDKDERQGAPPAFLLEDVATEDELGVPGDNGLIEIKEDVLRRLAHGDWGSGSVEKGNFNLGSHMFRLRT